MKKYPLGGHVQDPEELMGSIISRPNYFPEFHEDMSIYSAAREHARKIHLIGQTFCPTCGQMDKVYLRRMNLGVVLPLIDWYNKVGSDPAMSAKVLPSKKQMAFSLNKHWGFIIQVEEPANAPPKKVTHPKSDPRTRGWWQMTPEGLLWVTGKSRTKLRAIIYRDTAVKLLGRLWTIQELLSSKGYGFVWDEAMVNTPLLNGGIKRNRRKKVSV